MIVRSLDGLSAGAAASMAPRTSVSLTPTLRSTYAHIYRTQPYVRTAVDFLARNLASLPVHVFRRVADTDRRRLRDHGLARWLARPNSAQTRYRWWVELIGDLGIYGRAIRLKVRTSRPPVGLEAVRVPLEAITVRGEWFPEEYELRTKTRTITLRPSEVVDVGFFDPASPLGALSPIESLRRTLAEDHALGEYRTSFWKMGARPSAVIERDHNVSMTPEQVTQFVSDWARLYGGNVNAGKTPVLEPGMKYQPIGHSAQDSQVAETRKLTREEVGVAYHIPPPMLGMLEHATLSNVANLHRMLYQDVLGPWLVWLREEIERQLLPEFVDTSDVYCEWVTAAKLAGAFEDTAAALEKLTGRPIMTANEGRARLNLPRVDQPDADHLFLQPGTPGAPVGELEPAEGA